MNRLLLAAAFALLPSLAAAQSIEGNWHCKAGDTPGGLLTIYGPSYIYASATYGDPASGGGSLTWEAGGPRFLDGNLVSVLGVSFGQMIAGGGVVPMDLIGADMVRLTCFKRLEITTFALPLEGFGPPTVPPDTNLSVEPPPIVAPIPMPAPIRP
jgi:hypothetical protein